MAMLETKERLPRELIAMRVAAEFRGGEFVNLGIGIPNPVAEFTPPEKGVIFHAENGLLGIGRAQEVGKVEIPDMANAGGQPVTAIPGARIMGSAAAVPLPRGRPPRPPARAWGGGGAPPDTAPGPRRLFVAMEHTTKDGERKILRRCTYPLTAVGVVKKVFTDVAVISVTPDGL